LIDGGPVESEDGDEYLNTVSSVWTSAMKRRTFLSSAAAFAVVAAGNGWRSHRLRPLFWTLHRL